jgi:polysaccharide export outer membrane protein
MSFRNSWTVQFLFLVVLCAFVACASKNPIGEPPAEVGPGSRDEYIIGVTDRVQVSVWKSPELSVGVPVRSDGKISIPLLDDVQAEGLTPEELKEVVTQELSEYVSSPDVTVIVLETNSRVASVMGEGVTRSGVVPLARETRVLDSIALMGGFTTFAEKDDIRILRRTENGIVEHHFDYDAYVAGKAPGTNIVLRPGDHVVVPD